MPLAKYFVVPFLSIAFVANQVPVLRGQSLEGLNSNSGSAADVQAYEKTHREIAQEAKLERMLYIQAQRAQIKAARMWAEETSARPSVNAGHMFLAPPQPNYRWIMFARPTYYYY